MKKNFKGQILFGTAVVGALGSFTAGGTVSAQNVNDNFKNLGYKNLNDNFLEDYKKDLIKHFGLKSTEDLPKFNFDDFNDYAKNEIKTANNSRSTVKNIFFGTHDNGYIKKEHLIDYLEKYYEPAVLERVKKQAYIEGEKEGKEKAREEFLKGNNLNSGTGLASASGSFGSIFSKAISSLNNMATTFKNKIKTLDSKTLAISAAILAGSGYLLFSGNNKENNNEKINKKNRSYRKYNSKKVNKNVIDDDDFGYSCQKNDDKDNDDDDYFD